MEELSNEVASHPGLRLYHPASITQEGALGVNRFVHDVPIDSAAALAISRLSAGGQGFQGGDPRAKKPASLRTACFYCLQHGSRKAGTLSHFLWRCPATEPVRCQQKVAAIWRSASITHLHRNVWTWKQLAVIRRAITEMLAIRRSVVCMAGKATRRRHDEQLTALWEAASRGGRYQSPTLPVALADAVAMCPCVRPRSRQEGLG
jgi:hypothetical protein